MNGTDELVNEIEMKCLALEDFKKEIEEKKKKRIPEKQKSVKKVKVTVYIPEDAETILNQIYANAILKRKKVTKCDLMTKAIYLLANSFEKENQ